MENEDGLPVPHVVDSNDEDLETQDVQLLPLSDRDRDFFLDLLENPPEPTPAFRKAAAEYKRRRNDLT